MLVEPFPKVNHVTQPINWNFSFKVCCNREFPGVLYGNTLASYSNHNPLTYILTTTKLDATRERWITKLAKFNYTFHYHSGKSSVDAHTVLDPMGSKYQGRRSWGHFQGCCQKPWCPNGGLCLPYKGYQFSDSEVSSHWMTVRNCV